ncbi:NAD(P)-dependent oxidoreductase [Secundilactobacillus folii]|uniref:NAD(P)H-binding protein n=1 Tax=Secundilactobacillus folii TaxID=2678357 RepID=A0A7X2XUV3_9LACO|nr:NAD(P)H-binding protein [Secundilactobacillus folii]MTV81388.1 NAD(P)H-binding protein [Secundilactobacillus folii]
MKIAIIGATGQVGQGATREAVSRGHEVSAIVRHGQKAKELFGDTVSVVERDAMSLTRADLAKYDVIVDAFASDKAYQHLDLATHLVDFFREDDSTRLVFVIGASILKTDNGETMLAATLAQYANEPWIAAPIQQDHEYQYLQWIENVNWTIITPSTDFAEGAKGAYKVGGDHVITSAAGKTEVTFDTFAAAMIDEIEQPKHVRQQFSVVNA